MVILSSDPGAPYDTDYNGGDIDVITIHVSCSKPLFFGMDLADQDGKEDPNLEDFGKFTLTGGTDTNGDEICEVPPPPPSCSICDGDGSPKVTSLTFL